MITEHALLTVRPGAEADFERAFPRAREVVLASPGCLSARLLRGVESPSSYLLLIEWESVEAHTEGFRGSPRFAEWRSIVGPYFAGDARVDHYGELRSAEAAG